MTSSENNDPTDRMTMTTPPDFTWPHNAAELGAHLDHPIEAFEAMIATVSDGWVNALLYAERRGRHRAPYLAALHRRLASIYAAWPADGFASALRAAARADEAAISSLADRLVTQRTDVLVVVEGRMQVEAAVRDLSTRAPVTWLDASPWPTKAGALPNGSRVRVITRTTPSAWIAGDRFDHALLFVTPPADLHEEIRRRLVGRAGTEERVRGEADVDLLVLVSP